MPGDSSSSSATAPQYRRFSATEVPNANPRRRSSTTLTPTDEMVRGPKPPKRFDTLFEIEEQRPGKNHGARQSFAATQTENGEWAIQRYSRNAKKWVTENSGHYYDMALSAAKWIAPVAPEVTQGVGKVMQSAGYGTSGSLVTAGGALARAAVDGNRLRQGYGDQPMSQTVAQVSGVVGGLLNTVGQNPWTPESYKQGFEGGGLIGTGLSFAGSMNPPQFQQPNYDLNTQINPQFDPFQSPGELDSPTHAQDSYFPPTTMAERMSASTVTAPAVTSGADYGSSMYATSSGVSNPTMTSPAFSRSFSMADVNMSGGNGGYGASSYLPNESYGDRQDVAYDSASESDSAPKKKGKRR
ncbi:hypothetical protein ACFVGN_32615 [Streptomyces sp. NPDC057757]|uniref:hypothetical protein n=1 Tax=Streptomyces sp. NPDC057757 TaxID=3346241 RepID=UPI0036C676E7